MNDATLNAAIVEAKRFLVRATKLQQRHEKNDIYRWQGSRESGAVRRASMDLTRALADLRKS